MSMPELESLFSPLFDEYSNGENQVVSKSFVVTTVDSSDKRQQKLNSTLSTLTLATTVTADGNFDLEMMHICPRLPSQTFDVLLFEEEILAFLRFLGHSGEIRKLTDVNINKLHQPWRSFAAIINKFLSWKSTGYDSLRNKMNWHYVRDDQMFTTIKLVLRHQNTQQFGGMLPIELTNEDIKNSKANKEYYAVASGAAPPKTKASVRKMKSSADEGTGSIPGVPDVPTELSDEEISWKSSEDDDNDDDDDDDQDEGDDDDNQDEGNDDQDTDDEDDEFIHPKLTIHEEKATKDEESFDPIVQTPDNSDDEGNDDASQAQAKNDEFLKNLDENIQKIIKEQVKEPVKVHVSKILPKIKKTMNEQLEAEVLTRSSNSSKTSYVVAADLSEKEIKKILIEKMESNKSIHQSDEQRNLYKALVEAYESNKIILDTYEDIVTLKRRRDDDADKDEEPSAGSDWGSKKQREERSQSQQALQRRKQPGLLASLHKGLNLNKRLQASLHQQRSQCGLLKI
uniref:Uncharacterized protein n=1 Tax=Tanacetum cinerariifolium TaxID=118510 RepID=A0A6L2NBH1_TANCI|nr:hypothetical protein [Tanacetum cinerariifolium]